MSRAAEEGYATSPARQVLPAYGQDVMMSPRCSSRSRECRPSSRRPPPGRAQVQEQPFVQSKPLMAAYQLDGSELPCPLPELPFAFARNFGAILTERQGAPVLLCRQDPPQTLLEVRPGGGLCLRGGAAWQRRVRDAPDGPLSA